MMSQKSFVIIICALGISLAEHIDLGSVIFANILFRHGDRTPVDPYSTDPYANESLWPVPFGDLTNLGKEEHLLLGRSFRERYSHLLPQTYSRYDIYVRSTDVDRTLMSAEANLAGLYPPYGNQVWDKVKWLPIPVHTVPELEDNILAGKKECPRYNLELKKVVNSPEMREINERNKDLYEYVTKNSGNLITSILDIERVYDTLFIEELFNFTLPEWTKSVYPEKMKPLAELSFTLEAHTKILQRLRSGLLIGEMVDHIVRKSQNTLTPDRKVWIYSAHDNTISNFLMSLNLFEPHSPPYAATVLVELRVNLLKEHIVTISYKNSSGEPRLLKLPGCTVACPLKQFVKLTKDTIPDNWEEECLLNWKEYEHSINTSSIVAVLTSLVLVLILLVLLIIGFVYWHHNCDNNRYYLKLNTDAI
ncbi:prostatic acid phosphatase [Athalia rosae]|uniref:prostatic acid phosphatase n=1 Tax=Athalia rosae TaxID=37344 RepID=UPI002034747E|nr:prostatic acid phosphatase [Athalia rosae]